MPDTAAPAGKGLGATLGKKVGPLPLGLWMAGGLGLWWYFRKQQAGNASAAAGGTQPGYGTDPAGNFGMIDPNTGYVAGSSEDLAAQQMQGGAPSGGGGYVSGAGGAVGSSDTGAGSSNASGTATSTPGAPPGPTVPAPGAAPAAGRNWHYPAPTGLAASNVSDSGFQLTWAPVQGPGGQKPPNYTVATYQQNGVKVDQFISGSTSTREYGSGGKGLHPGWQYKVDVWANGGPAPPPHAETVVTLKPKGTK